MKPRRARGATPDLRYQSDHARRWSDLQQWHDRLLREQDAQWVFRGHKSDRWPLESTLERAIVALGGRAETGLEGCPTTLIEQRLVRDFTRRAHQYVISPPGDDVLEWLALMRHHGAPTRLLDWTYSFWVAVFFAVESSCGTSAVWALGSSWTEQAARACLPRRLQRALDSDPNIRRDDTFRDVFLSGRGFVLPINPHRLNERLTIQQSIFLCPGDMTLPFEANLAALQRATGAGERHLIKITITDDASARRNILRRLYRMNINAAVLFPGLDGYSGSLKTFLVWAHLFRKATPRPFTVSG